MPVGKYGEVYECNFGRSEIPEGYFVTIRYYDRSFGMDIETTNQFLAGEGLARDRFVHMLDARGIDYHQRIHMDVA